LASYLHDHHPKTGYQQSRRSRPKAVAIANNVWHRRFDRRVEGEFRRFAFILSHVAHYERGFSEQEIRDIARTGAIVMGLILAIEYFGDKLRKPK
jgi:hypothetical protein